MTKKNQLVAVDLFAGAGGLSLGASRENFRVAAAVELNADVTPTYRANHPGTAVFEKDICSVKGKELLTAIPEKQVDLLMGCAPCQGFCSLTAKNKRRDPRNRLIGEMARLVEELKPTAVIMENVPGLAVRGRRLFSEFTRRLQRAGYKVSWANVQMADYGVPQNRRRLVLLAGRGFAIGIPPATHSREAGREKEGWLTVRDAIHGERSPKRRSVVHPKQANWHVVRDLMPQTRARLKAAMPGRMRTEMDKELLPECHRDGYDGFRNVYMRMGWDAPSPTITAGCVTPAKGRFGHPDRRRSTISVREAATIQTFPKSFRFETEHIDVACQMIGNAVPPRFAQVLAAQVRTAIRDHHLARNK